jgi:hypothetical protein
MIAVEQGDFFKPNTETIAVHMWTQVFMGWSSFRNIALIPTYNLVEKLLPPTLTCPKTKTKYFNFLKYEIYE